MEFASPLPWLHMSAMVSQTTSLTIVYSTVYPGADKKTIKARVTGLCAGNSPVTGEFPAQRASNTENVSIWWRRHAFVWFSGGWNHFVYKSLKMACVCFYENSVQSITFQEGCTTVNHCDRIMYLYLYHGWYMGTCFVLWCGFIFREQ